MKNGDERAWRITLYFIIQLYSPSRKRTLETCQGHTTTALRRNTKLIKVIVHFNASAGSYWFNCTVRIFLSVAAVTRLLLGPTERARFLPIRRLVVWCAFVPRHSITVKTRRHCTTGSCCLANVLQTTANSSSVVPIALNGVYIERKCTVMSTPKCVTVVPRGLFTTY